MSRNAFLIVALPAIFQLVLLIGLFSIERAHNREREAELRRREVAVSAYRLLGLLVDTQTGARGYLLTGKPEFLEPYQRALKEIPRELDRFRVLARGASGSQLDEIGARAAASLAVQAENIRLIQSGARDRALDRVSKGIGEARMDAFRHSMQRFLSDEQRAAVEDQRHALESRRRLNATLAIGTAADIVICLLLLLFFSRKFTRRLSAVVDNTYRIERREELHALVGGDDEIGDLDRRVHDMAAAIRRAEENLNRFFTVSLEMLCIAGFDGYFKRLNPVWEATLGHSDEELRSRPFIDFVHPDDREATIAESQRLALGLATIRFENRYRCADESYRWLLWSAAALSESQTIYAAATDITERKQFEHTLQNRNAALEAANRDLESFSYSVSHDLRAPLRAVDGYARILKEEYAPSLDAEGLRLLEVVRSEARRMSVLIDDLLAFSRSGRQSLSPVDVDLKAVAAQVVDELRRVHPDRQMDLVSGSVPDAHADRVTIRQVLINLISNAVKYAKPDGPIHIELAGRDAGDHHEYWVRDQGIGFDMRYAEKIFGVFQRLHGEGELEGTGVGLAIVQRIIDRHGGRVWAEGEPGKGATFFFTLPTKGQMLESTYGEVVNARSGDPVGRGQPS